MMRKYFENILGLATGSDQDVKHAPNFATQFSVSKGEGYDGYETLIRKTHHPMLMPMFNLPKYHDIVLICTRFILDAEVSFFHLTYSQTHGISFKNEMLKPPIRDFWKDFHDCCIKCYYMWNKFWVEEAEKADKLVYFFRFEDVITNPEKELGEIMRFILGLESIDGTVI